MKRMYESPYIEELSLIFEEDILGSASTGTETETPPAGSSKGKD